MASWKLPLAVAAIAVPTAVAFFFGGPGVGVSVGALAGVAIVFYAVRERPRGAIGAPAGSGPTRLLVVVAGQLEDPEAIAEVARLAGADDGDAEADVMVLAPARIGFLDRWASDVEGARRDAQQRLVISVATLAAAGVEAEARVGDEDVVQAVEDLLGSFAADEVILVSGDEGSDPGAAEAAHELGERLRAGFRWVVVNDRGAR
ncbi:MAG TPA: hypothetical protein VFI17_13235 [Solirubrobacterales bacterium]|nr:hypothetical protein [Solirubrobacterales bacterium]